MLDQGVFQNIGAVTWDTTAKTAGFTAVSGNGYFVNTTSGAITVTLPAGSAGDIVSLADYAATWQTNNVTVTPNGTDKIGGVNANATLSTEGQSVTFVYTDSTQGWKSVQDSTSNVVGSVPFMTATGGTITTDGNCKIHTFTSPGTFTVCQVASCASRNKVAYMVVAGGGGAMQSYGGGGGAGGYREGRCATITPYTASPLVAPDGITVSAQSYPITVGAGGNGQNNPVTPTARTPGNNSVFDTITSAGGGIGCGQDSNPATPSANGGSGGGNGHRGNAAGSGNTPPVSPPQGQPGGSSGPNGYAGDGGGGASAAGGAGTQSGPSSTGANGGDGTPTSISGSATTYAGGGGGGTFISGTGGTGGAGGGGNSGGPPGNSGFNGTANTGGGGGGGSGPAPSGGSGGSGIVIIRYKYQ